MENTKMTIEEKRKAAISLAAKGPGFALFILLGWIAEKENERRDMDREKGEGK